jgi:hypothetical protein
VTPRTNVCSMYTQYTMHSVWAAHTPLPLQTPLPSAAAAPRRAAKPRPRSRCPLSLCMFAVALLSYAERKACVWVCVHYAASTDLLKHGHSVRATLLCLTVL